MTRTESSSRGDTRDKKKPAGSSKPMVNGRELCWEYNSKQGCKRMAIHGGCKNYSKEFAHACNVWVKNKSSYCLMSHCRKDHK